MKVNFYLTSLRINSGLSFTQLSEVLGVDRSTIMRYESGNRNPSRGVLEKMAAFFKVPIEDIINGFPNSEEQIPRAYAEFETRTMYLRKLREIAGLTTAEVAERVGVTLTTLNRYEREERRLPASMAISLSRVYKVPASDIMMGANQNPRKRKPKPVQKPIAVAPVSNSTNRPQLLKGDHDEEGVYQPTSEELLRLESYEDWRAKRFG
jgi:transcriptional regulator with XRE-family HTH domain